MSDTSHSTSDRTVAAARFHELVLHLGAVEGAAQQIAEAIQITIVTERLGDDPAINTYRVLVHTPAGEWPMRYASLEALEAFLAGAQALAACLGIHITLPELPRR